MGFFSFIIIIIIRLSVYDTVMESFTQSMSYKLGNIILFNHGRIKKLHNSKEIEKINRKGKDTRLILIVIYFILMYTLASLSYSCT